MIKIFWGDTFRISFIFWLEYIFKIPCLNLFHTNIVADISTGTFSSLNHSMPLEIKQITMQTRLTLKIFTVCDILKSFLRISNSIHVQKKVNE